MAVNTDSSSEIVPGTELTRKAFDLYFRGEFAQAEIACQSIIDMFPLNANALHLFGVLCLNTGRYEAAIETISKSIAVNAADPTTYNSLGEAYRALGRLQDAERCYLQAIALDATYAGAYCNLGVVLNALERYEDSESVLKNALKLLPDSDVIYGNLGFMYGRTGRLEDAEYAFKKAIEIRPDNVDIQMCLAKVLADGGKLNEAENSYRRALILLPDSAEIYNNLGLILNNLGRIEEAKQAFNNAISIRPEYAVAYNNLGIVCRGSGHLDDAVKAFRTSIVKRKDYIEAYCNLGIVLREQGLLYEAEEVFGNALNINPNHAEVLCNLAGALHDLGRVVESEAAYRQALFLKPDYSEAMSNLGTLLIYKNQLPEAAELFAQVVKLQPENKMAYHVNCALHGETSARAPDQYVSKLFDRYADMFDKHLVNNLKYRTPQELFELVVAHHAGMTRLDILDAGCGSGLVGELVAPCAASLIGVDLSPKMLEKARQKHLYHRLEESDLLLMMVNEPAESYDLIFAADVFVYIGELDAIISQTKRLLRPGGFFAFSTESLDALMPDKVSNLPQFKLMQTARYCHSSHYLRELAELNDFKIEAFNSSNSRMEQGAPVKAINTLYRKPEAPIKQKQCRLCRSVSVLFYTDKRPFYICGNCGLIFSDNPLSNNESNKHYQGQHAIDFNYNEYVLTILRLIPDSANLEKILDFGSGSGMMAQAFRSLGHTVDCYEPMYNGAFVEKCYQKYDLIIVNEVLEHVSDILGTFDNIFRACNKGGIIYVGMLMTDALINDPDNFTNRFGGWWYKNDLTHISFFCLNTFEYICSLHDRYNFSIAGNGPGGMLLRHHAN